MGRRRRRDVGPHGLLVVDKPAGVTSHDVVDAARRRLGQRRIGHAGTLDPPATGVLLLGVGRVTRVLRWLSGSRKSYRGEIVLGTATTTLDDTGEVTERHDMSGVTVADVAAAAARFVGDIEQIPPMVSAVRVGGRRLHEAARAGEEVEREPRPVTVDRFDVVGAPEPGVAEVEVICSAGTYVRTLADDLGRALGGCAHLRNLRRTAVGGFTVDEAAPVEDAALLPPAEAVRDLPSVVVDADVASRVLHGSLLDLDLAPADAAAVLDPAGELLAVYVPHRGRWKPGAVLVTGDQLPS